MTCVQQHLPLNLRTSRPLVPLDAVMCLLEKTEDEALELMESGALPVAFNLASSGARKRQLAVWRVCFWEYKEAGFAADRETEIVLKDIVPGHRLDFRLTEVKNMFCAKPDHVRALLAQGQLAVQGLRPVPALGPKSSPYITRTSILKFLTDRRIA
jgi:hypothetical protein